MSSSGNNTLVGGSGTTSMVLTGASAGNLAVAGSGSTSINAAGSTGALQITTNPLGNSGTLVATLGSGADTVVGGSGASTITAGSGNDVFGFVNGNAGGSEVIFGFNASDNIALGGYDYSLSDPPTEQVGSLGDVITLSDGTSITLVSVFHKLW